MTAASWIATGCLSVAALILILVATRTPRRPRDRYQGRHL